LKTYVRDQSATFRKTKDHLGELSNMCAGFNLVVNDIDILTSEALYQAMRFPLNPEIQNIIIAQRSPMTAKMKGKPHRHLTRNDWEQESVNIMRWCLEVKLANNFTRFSRVLLSTGEQQIVEDSHKDTFWGAVGGYTLRGNNNLGVLLQELRERIKEGDEFRQVLPLNIPNFDIDGEPIRIVERW
jgi:ribA/ribD-fused uncharacterized protein